MEVRRPGSGLLRDQPAGYKRELLSLRTEHEIMQPAGQKRSRYQAIEREPQGLPDHHL